MRRLSLVPLGSFLIVQILSGSLRASDQVSFDEAKTHPEVQRVLGFEEHRKQKRTNSQEQEKGLRLHLETLEIQAREYEKYRREYLAQKRTERPLELTPSYQEHLQERDSAREDQEGARIEQRRLKAEEKRLLNRIRLDAMRELGLPESRPRYENDKRALYGAEPKFTRMKETFPGGGGYIPPAPVNSPGSDNFPPPPSNFEDFPPPPAFPEDNFDLPPPMPGEDPSMPPGDDFFPPPPPPPPFEDNFNF